MKRVIHSWLGLRRIASPNHHVRALARLEAAHLVLRRQWIWRL